MSRPGVSIIVVLLTTRCGSPGLYPTNWKEQTVPVSARGPDRDELRVDWGENTRSPNPRPPLSTYHQLELLCGEPDERLDRAARWIGQHGPLGQTENEVDRLSFVLRAAGTPYVRPVAWSRGWDKTRAPPLDELEAEFRIWLTSFERAPRFRCGMAELDHEGQRRLVVIAAEAPVELALPLPTTARVGQWLTFKADLRDIAGNSQVILLGPTGEPLVVPSSQQGNHVTSRFAAASPGKWLVQLLASAETGPRPMLEAVIYVDVPKERVFAEVAYPGESAANPNSPPAQSLDLMVTAARKQTGRPPLRRDDHLDALALEHATLMRRAGRVGHDVGYGTTRVRLSRAGMDSRLAGENVVHAASPQRAHRAFWASPSHRTNLLHRGFGRWGLGIATDTDGTLWVCELFASSD